MVAFDKYADETHIRDSNRALRKRVAELTLECGRLQALVDLMVEQAEEDRYDRARMDIDVETFDGVPE